MTKTATIIAGVLLGILCAGQSASAQGIPHDWSHHHLIFSTANTPLKEQQLKRNPRYKMQQLWRHPELSMNAQAFMQALDAKSIQLATASSQQHKAKPTPTPVQGGTLHRDWSVSLGSSATAGAGQYPAKYSFATSSNSANCLTPAPTPPAKPDFVVFNTGLTGSSTKATIVAFTNLYTSCTNTVPSVYWAYNTGSSAIVTSVVLSGDGTQVAFVQGQNLVLLKWAASTTQTVTSPLTLTAVAASSYHGSSAPCMTTLALGANDSTSSPFYDYSNDVIYVGDSNKHLHKFINVFNDTGTPAEAANWPSGTLDTSGHGSSLSSPVYDSVSGNVYVADMGGNSGNSAGYLYRVSGGASPGAAVSTGALGSGGPNNVDAPVVDSAAGMVYAFEGSASTNAGVFQFPVAFTGGATGTKASVGTRNTSTTLYAGSFDNTYYTSVNPASPTGSLYVCGNVNSNPILYRIAISSGSFGTVTTGPKVSNSSSAICSPVTEFFDGTNDKVFLSVTTQGNSATELPSGCSVSTGCVLGYTINSGISSSSSPSVAAAENGGTSGIVIDNSAGSGGSQIYFSTLSPGASPGPSCGTGNGCGVQASQ
jgi:hypothetical protein